MPIAVTRAVSPAIARCELTHMDRGEIRWEVAMDQHRRYESALVDLGFQLISLPAESEYPDSVFVEDTAIVLPELAVLTRPGAPSRRGETSTVAATLAPYRSIHPIVEPAILDGGDVLVVGKSIHVGMSARSDEAAVEQLRTILEPHGYVVQGVAPSGCLHLKSAITQVSEGTLLYNREWVDGALFPGMELIEIDASEPFAANAVWIPDPLHSERESSSDQSTVIHAEEFPKTRRRLEDRGIRVIPVPASELAKAEGGVTCCSLLFEN